MKRECDPDLCSNCGAIDILDPVNRYEDDKSFFASKCRNCFISRELPKRTLLGDSKVEGFGLYAGEAIKKDDFIAEYKGEITCTPESDRRAHIYHWRSAVYVFNLNRGM
jgi:hypothetical protein